MTGDETRRTGLAAWLYALRQLVWLGVLLVAGFSGCTALWMGIPKWQLKWDKRIGCEDRTLLSDEKRFWAELGLTGSPMEICREKYAFLWPMLDRPTYWRMKLERTQRRELWRRLRTAERLPVEALNVKPGGSWDYVPYWFRVPKVRGFAISLKNEVYSLKIFRTEQREFVYLSIR